ncbi:GNAT family N-acetyltransferase [Hyphobacterium sp.]|uniref:GNAT family N-acetyltransferase n=1 Tax=Hyphobacterium sp. TaxID=2004662 RepID=UPI003BAAE0BF
MTRIQRITPGLLTPYLDFFDNRAFGDNADWSGCYCNCLYADHCEKPWKDRAPAENRAAVQARILRSEMGGYLAFDGERAVGWCGAAPMNSVPAFDEDEEADRDRIGVIYCFVVDPAWRRKGVARALLRTVCDDFRTQGLVIAEGNPRPKAKSAADLHFGPLPLFLSEGFTHHRYDPEDGSVYVRKAL